MSKNRNRRRPNPESGSRFSRSLKRLYVRFIRIRGEPREIALGFALGLFIGMSPTMGFQMAIAVFLAALLKWNKISAAAGVWITNPVTAPFVYGGTYLVGSKILGTGNVVRMTGNFDITAIGSVLRQAPEVLLILSVGGIVIGVPVAFVGYYFSYKAVERYQEDLKEKLERQKERLARKGRKIKRKKRKKS
jgi:uncharacterized protein (DUF2062 family)